MKKFIKSILALFVRDHAKASAKALSTFDVVRRELIEINARAITEQEQARDQIAKLQARDSSLQEVVAKNAAVAENIGKLLGEYSEVQ